MQYDELVLIFPRDNQLSGLDIGQLSTHNLDED
jgi:hypothetical protein